MPVWLQVFLATIPLAISIAVYLYKIEARLRELRNGVQTNRRWNVRLLMRMFPEKRIEIQQFLDDEAKYGDANTEGV